mgnify:CR=1 FL=1
MLEIKTVDELIDLVKRLKFLGVTQFKIGEVAMDITGDTFQGSTQEVSEDEDDEEVLYYSA